MVPPLPLDPPNEASVEEAMEELSDGVAHFSEAIWNSFPSFIVPCYIRGIVVEAHCNPIREVNIMPCHLAETLLGDILLGPSDMLLKSCSFGHILECWGVVRVMPLMIDKIEINLDFHIFDILDLDLLLGYPLEKLFGTSIGSLDRKLREVVFATTISC
jgi:hypothetical protein